MPEFVELQLGDVLRNDWLRQGFAKIPNPAIDLSVVHSKKVPEHPKGTFRLRVEQNTQCLFGGNLSVRAVIGVRLKNRIYTTSVCSEMQRDQRI